MILYDAVQMDMYMKHMLTIALPYRQYVMDVVKTDSVEILMISI